MSKIFNLFKRKMSIDKAVKKYLGVDPTDKNEKIYVFKYFNDGYAIGVGKSDRYAYKDWINYSCCLDKVAYVNEDNVLYQIGYDVVKDTDLFIMGERKKMNIQIVSDGVIEEILNES